MKISLENIILIVGLILAEAWFLNGFFLGRPEYEPAIAFLVTFGAIFAKDPIKEKFTGSGESKQHDKNIFAEFQKALPAEPTIRLFKEHDFGNSFHQDSISPLTGFISTWDIVEKEFLDKKLEKKKKELYAEANKLAMEISGRTVPVGRVGNLSVYSDSQRQGRGQRPASVIEDAKILNDMSSQFVSKYEEFIRLCRSKLAE
jgi:hypothetical protein